MAGATIVAACGLFVTSMVCDVRRRRIPNAIPVALLALFLVHALVGGAESIRGLWMNLAIGAGLLAAGFALYLGGGFGAGDAKLIAVAGVWAGPTHLGHFLLALAGTALALSLFALLPFEATRRVRRELPFAVAIAPPALVVILPRVFAQEIQI